MTARDRRTSVPAPLPRATSAQGSEALVISGNVVSTNGPNPAAPTGATGSFLSTVGGLTFTPKIGTRARVSFSFSGFTSATTPLMTFTLKVDGTTVGTINAAPGGDGTTVLASGEFIATSLTLGAPHVFDLFWSASTGNMRPYNGIGQMSVQELPN